MKLNKQQIPIARNHNSKFDLSADHVTTLGFLRVQPVYYANLVAGQSIRLNALGTVRPAPMNVPTFGRMRCNLRSFFVPYRLCMPQYDNMMNDVIGSNQSASSLVASPPVVNDYVLSLHFLSAGYTTDGTAQNYDFIIPQSISPYPNNPYIKLTERGRHAYKILYSLGYDLLWSTKDSDFVWNAFALLAYAKIIVDWYSNTNYLDSADILAINQALSFNSPNSNLVVSASLLISIFNVIDFVTYDTNGYFENCFDTPVAPSSGQFTPLSWTDNIGVNSSSLGSVSISTASNGTPYMRQAASSAQNIGDHYMHDMLERITSYQRRHALAGSLAIDRFLAQHGRITDHLRSQRSIYCGVHSFDVDVKSVFATANGSANNQSSEVGDYAGAGFGQSSKDFDFIAEEDGIFIVMASILPSGGYYQGYDRCNRRLNKTDFFNEEFDGTVQGIEKGEVFVSKDNSYCAGSPANYAGIFAYIGRYAEVKKALSRVSGDISLPSVIAGGDSWHLMRDLSSHWQDVTSCVHSLDFTRGLDADNYNRIFNYTDSDYDPFFGFFHFAVGSYAPMRPLFDMFDFPENGKEITLERGAKVN